MKRAIKYVLQKMLGYHRYLYRFARFKIKNLEGDKKEGDFFAFMDEVQGKGLILDVGANIGIMTYHLSKRFSDRSVIAIEPVPSNYAVLERIVNEYGLKNVELKQCAVGEEDTTLEMVIPNDGKVKMQGLAHVVHDSITEWNEGEKLMVPSLTLDGIAGKEKVAGIKMDIENFEYFALKGAEELLKRDKPVLYLELWENENRDNCFGFLEGLGYSIYVNSAEGLIIYDPSKHKKQNFVFK